MVCFSSSIIIVKPINQHLLRQGILVYRHVGKIVDNLALEYEMKQGKG